ncbi:MAG: ATP-binding protein [Pseudomonadota bacterium]
MRSIIDALPEPVLLLDRVRRVVSANMAADALFDGPITGANLVRAIREPEVLSAVDRVLSGAAQAEAQLVLRLPVRATYRVQIMRCDRDEERAAEYSFRDDGFGASDEVVAVVSLQDISPVIEAESIRSDFVANVSHELRSPLTALTSFIETLQTGARDDADARDRFLSIMAREAHRMDRLIDDLLSLAKLEANARVRPDGAVDLRAVLNEVIDTIQTQKDGRDVRLFVPEGMRAAMVPGTHDQLVQVFRNLVDNAVKYSPHGEPVTVTISEAPSAPGIVGAVFTVSVRDEGEGIASEHLPRLTERFYRVDAGRSRQKGGTGLGLAIVKHIVSRHRGRLRIESTDGVGSTFSVDLPRSI